jgi:hypothetical protein
MAQYPLARRLGGPPRAGLAVTVKEKNFLSLPWIEPSRPARSSLRGLIFQYLYNREKDNVKTSCILYAYKELTFNSFNENLYKRPVSAEMCGAEVRCNIGHHILFFSAADDIVMWMGGCAWLIRRVLVWIIGFIDTLYTPLELQTIQHYCWSAHFTVHRYTHTRALSLH